MYLKENEENEDVDNQINSKWVMSILESAESALRSDLLFLIIRIIIIFHKILRHLSSLKQVLLYVFSN